jgi:hypothetical protein
MALILLGNLDAEGRMCVPMTVKIDKMTMAPSTIVGVIVHRLLWRRTQIRKNDLSLP